MKSCYYSLIFLLFPSCGMLNSLRKQHYLQEIKQQQYEQRDSLQLETQHARSYLSTEDQWVHTVLEPEGWFQITRGQGFQGKASKVVIRQLYRSAISQTDTGRLKLSQATQINAEERNHLKTRIKEQEKKKRPEATQWILSATVLLLLFLLGMQYVRNK